MTDTPMLDYLPTESKAGMLKSVHLLDRIVEPEEVIPVATPAWWIAVTVGLRMVCVTQYRSTGFSLSVW